MAPETFDRHTCLKSDIYSFGITLIELAQGKNPNSGRSEKEVMQGVSSSFSLSSSKFSPEFVDFVHKCLAKDPHKRPSAAELLEVRFEGAIHS